MKKIAILFVVFFCSVSLWAQTIEDDATWKLKTDTVRALKHYKAGDNWFIGIQAGADFVAQGVAVVLLDGIPPCYTGKDKFASAAEACHVMGGKSVQENDFVRARIHRPV